MDTVVVNTNRAEMRMSWSAIFGGTVVTLGIWMLLHTLGLAAGLTAIDPQDQGSLRGIGIGTGIWSVIAPLVALFAGGFVAAYTAGPLDRASGTMHGVVLWGLTALAGTLLVAMAVASTVRAGAQAGMSLAARGVAAGAAVDLQDLGLRPNDLLAPVNQRLGQQGIEPITVAELEGSTRALLGRAAREGELNQADVVAALTQNTRMSADEARQIAGQMSAAFDQRVSELRRAALVAADRTGKALWGVFLAMLLGLIAAAGGAAVGTGRRARRVALERPSTPTVPSRQIPVETTT